MNTDLHDEIRELIVDAVMLEDVIAADIDVDAPLFGTGLGLDSIDVLELALALEKRYGVQLKANDEQNQAIFANVRVLAAHVATQRVR